MCHYNETTFIYETPMTHTLIQQWNEEHKKPDVPELRSGLIVEVHEQIHDGKRTRTQIFKGLIIHHKGGKSLNTNITVRKMTGDVAIEKTFSVHSPKITKIVVKQAFKVRRNYLSFLRGLTGKAARLKEVPITKVTSKTK
jgi:large subunit ribosomal protein L19